MQKYFTLAGLLIVIASAAQAQLPSRLDDLVLYYDFQRCDRNATAIIDNSHGDPNARAEVIGNKICRPCGIGSQGFYFDGETHIKTDSVGGRFPSNGAFALSFLIQPEDGPGKYEILSRTKDCNADTSLLATYEPATRRLEILLRETNDNRAVVAYNVPEHLCWFHVVVTRRTDKTALYINGNRVDADTSRGTIALGRHDYYFGGRPCSDLGLYKGMMDEIRLYKNFLDGNEVRELFSTVNFVVGDESRNITLGQSELIETQSSCATNISWSPSNYLSDPNSPTPIITPEGPITYTVSFVDDFTGCTTLDTLIISVTDPRDLDCKNILAPTAFRPSSTLIANRVFKISSSAALTELITFEIYDRKGLLLWQTNDENEGWDGTFKGQPLPPDTYFYKLRYLCADQVLNYSNTVFLLR